jgi:hypothetical protein
MSGAGSGARPSAAELVDHWIFVFMAGLFVVTALVGFVPDSIAMVKAANAGTGLPLPPVLHVHAVLMGSWLLLLLAQTTLAATGHTALHRKLGLASLVVAPGMVIAGLLLVPTIHHELWNVLKTAPPPAVVQIKAAITLLSSVVLLQVRVGVVFAILIALALLARRSDPGLHKRLMILATVLPLPAAIDRMQWLPTSYPGSPTTPELYTFLWITPMLAWDLFRSGRVHRAYWIWLAANAPFLIAEQGLWGSPWWQATVPKLMGVS